MVSKKQNIYKMMIFTLVYILLTYSLFFLIRATIFGVFIYHSYNNIAVGNIDQMWSLKDKSVGLQEDLVGFVKFCRGIIPYDRNVLFYTPYSYYGKYKAEKNFIYAYHPYRARFYMCPGKLLWFNDRYKKIGIYWEKFDKFSRMKMLKNVDFVIGFDINEKMFPGFVGIADYKNEGYKGIVLKRQE